MKYFCDVMPKDFLETICAGANESSETGWVALYLKSKCNSLVVKPAKARAIARELNRLADKSDPKKMPRRRV